MTYTKDQVFESYARLGSVKAVCAETGCPPYNAYIWLQKAKLLVAGDKVQYGQKSSQEGGRAEIEFQRLVPEAADANAHMQSNNPTFDFVLGDIYIDVKYSSINKAMGKWGFDRARHKHYSPDLYCTFFATAPSGLIRDGYHCLLIPHDVITVNRVWLAPGDEHSPWWQFAIDPADLRKTLLDMAGLRDARIQGAKA